MKIFRGVFILSIGMICALNGSDSIQRIPGNRFTDGTSRIGYNVRVKLPGGKEIRNNFEQFFLAVSDSRKLLTANQIVDQIANKKLSRREICEILVEKHTPSISGEKGQFQKHDEDFYNAANFLIEMALIDTKSSKQSDL